jgi:hypothetical protein
MRIVPFSGFLAKERIDPAMARRFRIAFPLLLLLASKGWAQAQAVPSQCDVAEHGTAEISLGQSAVPVYGPWKFTVGDSPINTKTGQPLWAEPDFDDARWETVDLTPKEGSFDFGSAGYVPGWEAKGHPGYWGYAWYRIRVHLQERPGEKLALAGPSDVDDAYQVFDNGELVGSFGDFTGSTPVVYSTQPMMFPSSHPAGGKPGSPPGCWHSEYGWSLTRSRTSPMRGASTLRRCWARPARWQPVTRSAGWN